MKCQIIQDLLPLYCDKLTSAESNMEIEQHLEGCKTCMEVYTQMKTTTAAIPADRNIKPLQKMKRRSLWKMIAGFAAGVLLLGTLFAFLFIGIVPAASKDVEISYRTEVVTNDSAQEHREIIFTLATDDGRVLSMRVSDMLCMDENGENAYSIMEIRPYRTFQIPFTSQWGKEATNVNTFKCNDTHHAFNENDVVKVQFRDETVTFRLDEIAAEDQ